MKGLEENIPTTIINIIAVKALRKPKDGREFQSQSIKKRK
jgi:hypothetical protein